jgi:hypothetical protein
MSVLRLRSPFDRQLALPFATPTRAATGAAMKPPAEQGRRQTAPNWLRQAAEVTPMAVSAEGARGSF